MYVYMCTYVYRYIHIYICILMCSYMHTYIHTHTFFRRFIHFFVNFAYFLAQKGFCLADLKTLNFSRDVSATRQGLTWLPIYALVQAPF